MYGLLYKRRGETGLLGTIEFWMYRNWPGYHLYYILRRDNLPPCHPYERSCQVRRKATTGGTPAGWGYRLGYRLGCWLTGYTPPFEPGTGYYEMPDDSDRPFHCR